MRNYAVSILLLLLWLLVIAAPSEAQCTEYCYKPQYNVSWACIVAWQWLSPEDEYEFPLVLVTVQGDYKIEDTEDDCGEEETVEEETEPTDDRIDWQSYEAAVFAGDNGAEIYCLDTEGNGTLAIALDAETPNETDFGCGVFYRLETCEYQLNLSDGLVIIADNLWFIGAYYGATDFDSAVGDFHTGGDGDLPVEESGSASQEYRVVPSEYQSFEPAEDSDKCHT